MALFLRFIALVLLLSGLWGHAAGAGVSLNSTNVISCVETAPCPFLDPAIWTNSIPPSTNDAVSLDSTSFDTVYLLFDDATPLLLGSLESTSRVNLVLLGYANMTVGDMTLAGPGVILTLRENAVFTSIEHTWVEDGAQVVLDTTAHGGYVQYGSTFTLGPLSEVIVHGDSSLALHSNNTYISGHLDISESLTATFVSTGKLFFINQVTAFANTPVIHHAYFEDSTVDFRRGWIGQRSASLQVSNVTIYGTNESLRLADVVADSFSMLVLRGVLDCTLLTPNISGTLYISSSNVFVFQNQTFDSPLIIGGVSGFEVDDLVLLDVSFTEGENGEPAYATIVAETLQLDGDFQIPGEIHTSKSASINGSIQLRGGVNVNGELHVAGSFLCFEDVVIGLPPARGRARGVGHAQRSSLVLDGAFFNAAILHIGNANFISLDSVVSAHIELSHNGSMEQRNSSFLRNIHNDGSVYVHDVLIILGDFQQGSSGTLIISSLDLVNRSGGYVGAVGDVSLGGTLEYSIKSAALSNSEMRLLAVQATGRVSGRFRADPTNVGPLRNAASAAYAEHSVYLVFGKPSKGKKSLWWVWLVSVLGVAAVAGLLTLLYLARNQRREYLAIPLRG